MSKAKKTPWYADGLKFECLWPTCSACCGGQPGYVWVTPAEVEAIAAELSLTFEQFIEQHCLEIDGRMTLVETGKANNYNCVFLVDGACRIYRVRPEQCQSYPFWPEVLESPATWNAEKGWCPGIGRGKLWSREEIEAKAEKKAASKRPFWFEQRVLDDVRRELLKAALEHAREKGRQLEDELLDDDES